MPGTIYGHVFENSAAGRDPSGPERTTIERALFWALSVPFEPLDFEGEEVRPLLQCE